MRNSQQLRLARKRRVRQAEQVSQHTSLTEQEVQVVRKVDEEIQKELHSDSLKLAMKHAALLAAKIAKHYPDVLRKIKSYGAAGQISPRIMKAIADMYATMMPRLVYLALTKRE